jgi:hypothetical protein
VVRQIADHPVLRHPDDEPGNDDLGAMSSWYVWAAIGLYPVTPGTADLALASPLFPTVVLALPDVHPLREDHRNQGPRSGLDMRFDDDVAHIGGNLEPALVALLDHHDGRDPDL